MFYKKLDSGKYRYFEKYFDEVQNKWRQVTVTMNSKSRASQSEAKNILSRKIDKRLKEIDTEGERKPLSVQEVFDEWQLLRVQELKKSSSHVERSAFNKFLKVFGKEKISNVTTHKMQKFLLELEVASTTRTIRKVYCNLFFSYAKRMGYIKENPISNVILPKKRQTHEEIVKKQEKFLDKNEVRKVLNYLYESEWHFRKALMFEFLFLTGLRVGELLALQWEDLDIDNQTITIRHTLNNHGVPARLRQLSTPKTSHSYRTLFLNDRCMDIVSIFANECKDNDFIFVGSKKQTYGRDTLSIVFKKACLKVLGEGHYTLHMLRHSHISLLVEMDIPIKVIMERVGHSNEKMILQIYSHVTKTMESNLLLKLNDLDF